MICPNTSHPVWKEMVEALGVNRAYFVFDKNEGYIDDERFVELLKTNNRNQAYVLRANELISPNVVNYTLKSVEILQSDLGKQVFEKGKKNNWSLEKILTELQIHKEQKEVILNLNIRNREDIILELSSQMTFAVEINTAKGEVPPGGPIPEYLEDSELEERYYRIHDAAGNNSQYYSNITVPGGVNYTENEFKTPQIIPSIKGHAQFSTDNGIGWGRWDEKIQYTEQDIDFLIDILKKSGQLEINCK